MTIFASAKNLFPVMAQTGGIARACRTGVRTGMVIVALIAVATGSLQMSSLASAQSSEMQSLLDRLNRLERDFNDVQRQFYRGEKPSPRPLTATNGSSAAAPAPAMAANPEAYALLSERLDQLESEQRNMTGPLEEANFKLDQMAKRLDKLVRDVDFRLTAIEGRLASGSQAAPGVGQGIAVGPETPSALNSGTAPAGKQIVVNEGQLRPGVQVLGKIAANPDASATAPEAPAAAAAPGAEPLVAAAPAILPPGNPQEQYNFAIDFIRKSEFEMAEAAFTEFLEKHKEHTLAGNAQYWLGEAHYVRGDFPNAASAFLAGYQEYPKSTKAADNLLKLAMSLIRMDQKEEACAALVQLKQQFTKLPSRVARAAAREEKSAGCQNN